MFRNAGSVGETLLVWTFGGVLSLLGALCYCELGTFIEKSGGDYIYLKIAYGRFIGFLYSWVNVWFLEPGSHAILSLTFAVYVVEPFFPSRGTADTNAAKIAGDCHPPFGLVKLLAACSICMLTAVNCISIRLAARAQVLFTCCKLIAVASIVIVAVISLLSGNTSGFDQHGVFVGSATWPGDVGHAFYSVMWAYSGWNGLNFITEEIINPNKNFPRTLMISIPLVTICYILINLAYFSVLSKEQILASDAVALTFASRLSPILGAAMPLIVSLSCFGSLNTGIFSSARIIFSIARERQLPSSLAMVHRKSQAPIPAILLRASLALLMLIPTNIENLLNCLVFMEWLILAAVFIGLIWLRWKKPDTPRAFKVNIIVAIFMAAVSLYFTATPFFSNPVESVFGLTVIVAGIPAYYVFIKKDWTSKSERFSRFSSKMSYYVQVIFNVVNVQ
ncbi:b(0,+)-type amino acid transporter 1 [Desmophyllum pertusum]|uniref:B(0,+)-type amino acid transporter 1 n=1 Tax=Desmophyllum pertusum TaxID=174260 RepID=A0A9W9ZPY8_9CNID|nr:b(0,+)-type amino acid transporter 1 [Desmophyllum pertusum]